MAHKVINFGYFVRAMRERMDLSRVQFISKAEIKLSERRLWQIEMDMAEPKVLPQKSESIARALGMDRDQLEKAWKSTPVNPPIDEGRTRKTKTDPLGIWLATEAMRLNIGRPEASKKVVALLRSFADYERDEMYATRGKGSGSSSLRIPKAGKDSRLRPAAKPLHGKAKGR